MVEPVFFLSHLDLERLQVVVWVRFTSMGLNIPWFLRVLNDFRDSDSSCRRVVGKSLLTGHAGASSLIRMGKGNSSYNELEAEQGS